VTLTLTPIAALLVAATLSYILTPFIVKLAIRSGAVDKRITGKIHAYDVPRLGGIAIAIAFYVPVLGLALRFNLFSSQIYEEPRRIGALLGGGLIILALGVFDDLKGARAWQKLVVQIPVAVLIWWAGLRIGGTVAPGAEEPITFSAAFSLAATVAWVVLVVNALNLIDGLDGLASGIALQALAATAIAAWHRDSAVLALFAICLFGSVGGFLVHNFHPASIFMGDSGSMFLGYVLAVSTIWTSQKTATLIGAVLPAIALGVPLLDTSMAIVRRLVRRQPVMHGDLDHLHHRLLRRGLSQRQSVLLLYGVSLVFNAMSVTLVYINDWRLHWPIVGAAVVAAVLFARWLGYHKARANEPASATAPAHKPARPE
jgi:UDP-GlcNAc:undecaprenyl-phosphate/decaprenyl-phosphate GlcNAc-1-phosphate transferase